RSSLRFTCRVEWNGNKNLRPRPRRGFQYQDTFHFGDALFDANQADASGLLRRNIALAVVLDAHDVTILFGSQVDHDRSRLRVPRAVGERLLNDAVQADLVRVRQLFRTTVIVQI